MTEQDIEGYKPITVWIDEGDLLISGTAILEVIDSDSQKRMLKTADVGEITVWGKLGWLEAIVLKTRQEITEGS